MSNRAIIYTVGQTYMIYFNLTDEEAERRWQEARSERSALEVAYEVSHNLTPKRDVVEFTDELMIWGNAGNELQEMSQVLLSQLGEGFRHG